MLLLVSRSQFVTRKKKEKYILQGMESTVQIIEISAGTRFCCPACRPKVDRPPSSESVCPLHQTRYRVLSQSDCSLARLAGPGCLFQAQRCFGWTVVEISLSRERNRKKLGPVVDLKTGGQNSKFASPDSD